MAGSISFITRQTPLSLRFRRGSTEHADLPQVRQLIESCNRPPASTAQPSTMTGGSK